MMTPAVLAVALAATQAQGLPLKPEEVRCDANGVQKVMSSSGKVQRLTDLPPANLELAVNRTVNGCSIPVIVVRDVEAGRAAPPVRREGAPSRRR